MAQSTAEREKLIDFSTFGSLAYDLNTATPLPEKEWEYQKRDERKIVIPAAPPQTEERRQTRALPRPRQSVSPFSVIGFVCAAVLLVFSLMAKIQLTVVTDQAAALESQLQELNSAQARLLITHESVFNRTEIEEYAINTLGMQRPREEQIIYLNSAAPDKAVILETEDSGQGFLDKLLGSFGFIAEYFE